MPVYLTHADLQGKVEEATFNTISREAIPPFSPGFLPWQLNAVFLTGFGGDGKQCVPDVYAQLEDKV